jgi:hypothetical protein
MTAAKTTSWCLQLLTMIVLKSRQHSEFEKKNDFKSREKYVKTAKICRCNITQVIDMKKG